MVGPRESQFLSFQESLGFVPVYVYVAVCVVGGGCCGGAEGHSC